MAERYKIGTITRLSGFSPDLLRVWERRHGLLEPERTEGGQRLYTEEDLRVLLAVRRLVDQGRTIGEIARRGRADLLASAAALPAGVTAAQVGPSPPLEAWRVGLADAASDLDPSRLGRILDEAAARLLPLEVARDVITPAAVEIGTRWAAGACSVAGEHLATATFSRRLAVLLERARHQASGPPVVVTCLPDERHGLGALVQALEQAERGRAVHHLGTALPLEDLERAARRLEAHEVLLSSTLPDLYAASRERLADLARRLGHPVRVVVGGQGVPATDPDLDAAGVRREVTTR